MFRFMKIKSHSNMCLITNQTKIICLALYMQNYHSMGTCAAQLTCLRKVCGHVTVSDHRLSKPEGFNVSFYVYMW
jgi:hypothetical protein